jgi:hypothetical protein
VASHGYLEALPSRQNSGTIKRWQKWDAVDDQDVIEGRWLVVGEDAPESPPIPPWSFWDDDFPHLFGCAIMFVLFIAIGIAFQSFHKTSRIKSVARSENSVVYVGRLAEGKTLRDTDCSNVHQLLSKNIHDITDEELRKIIFCEQVLTSLADDPAGEPYQDSKTIKPSPAPR